MMIRRSVLQLLMVILMGSISSCAEPENVSLVQVHRFPPPDVEDPEYYFAIPNDFELLPNGLVAVVDWMQHTVWIVNQDGSLVAEIGRQGQGPGEFYFPDETAYDASTQLLWVRDRNQLQAFNTNDWSLSHGFRRGAIRGIYLEAIDDTLYMAAIDATHDQLVHVFSSSGELVRSFGSHLEREVGPKGIGIHKVGSLDISLMPDGELVGCYTYSIFNDILLITSTSQTTIHIRDKDITKTDRENRRKAVNWPDSDNGRSPPYTIYSQSVLCGDRIFILLTRLVGQRIIEVDMRGRIVNNYSFPTPPDVKYPSPIGFKVQIENEAIVVWMMWNNPYPHIVKLVPHSSVTDK